MDFPDLPTGDGYPIEMQTNHLAQFLLASKLLRTLMDAADRCGTARIVTHSSVKRNMPPSPVIPAHYGQNTGNLGGDSKKGRGDRYTQTKLANVCFVQALKV
jgi:NAD(P)-dependent dehydrogenase (short-subunit alcohol dehydrogenase family)